MRIFAPRKSRTAKAASLKASTSWSGRLGGVLSQSDVLLRLIVAIAFLAVMVATIGSWRAPFRFRVGDYAPDGIQARIDFERVNRLQTELEQLKAERRVPPIYRQDPGPVIELTDQLRRHLFEVAAANDPSELSAEAQAAFGFTPDALSSPGSGPELLQQWNKFKEIIGTSGDAELHIDELLGEFNPFILPMRQTGVLDPSETAKRELQPDDLVTVVEPGGPSDGQAIPLSYVLIEEMLKSAGRLGGFWNSYPRLKSIQPILERWLLQRTKATYTLTFDEAATNRARNLARLQTPPVSDSYKRGSLLVPPGSVIGAESLEILKAQYATAEQSVTYAERLVRVLTVLVLLTVLWALNGYYLVRNEQKLTNSLGRLTTFLAAVTASVALGRILSADPWHAEIIPLLCTVMILTIAYNQVLGALTGFSLSLLQTFAVGGGVGDFMVQMSAVATAVVLLNHVPSRSKVVKVGMATALVYFLVVWGIGVIENQRLNRLLTDQQLLIDSLRGAGWCLAAGYLVAGSLPFIEQLFGVVTDISLLELSDISHPLLQELVRRAPGTYNHSIGVATLAEAAADAIGANGLLCRVGAYFHDIGKMLKPQYFVENMLPGEASRHQQLVPAMSTLIIIGHVKDGSDLARQHHVPKVLVDFIEQHHGTTLVEYFYHAATKQAETQPDHRFDVEESAFRYPGPKPQSKETAVLMIADAVEGATRALADPTPKRLEALVHEIAMKRLLDGQFDECSLTLRELAIVEDSLTKSLIGIHHGRIRYPEQRTA
ncbi:MAG: HDIG domain-containing protein [Planctomycetaceae bacterium]